jgi:hypothetical protein
MSSVQKLPDLDVQSISGTRDALHAYARILGDWLKSCRPRRKHWWHASLRPSLAGLTSGIVNAEIDFELDLDLRESQLLGRTADGAYFAETLQGQPASALAQLVSDFLVNVGIDTRFAPDVAQYNGNGFRDYSAEHANSMARVLNMLNAAMTEFRAGIREETSPIQLWPHHFDLSMLWLPGEKIPGQDPENEEYSDKQMNFGFTFGDEGIPEPYFYVTAYPLPHAFASLPLPAGSEWRTEGFSGVVLLYRSLLESRDPNGYLQDLWNGLLSSGRENMLDNTD